MTILAIDPGSKESAVLMLQDDEVSDPVIWSNEAVLGVVQDLYQDYGPDTEVVIETIEPWGGFVGPPALETMYWVGRFEEAARPLPVTLLHRSKVLPALGVPKLPKGKAQSVVRTMLIERWGGGNPVRRDHPLHGIREDLWSALALAVAYQEGLRP